MKLTETDLVVLKYIYLTNKQIGKLLYLSRFSITYHVQRLKKYFHVKTRIQVMQAGLNYIDTRYLKG